MAGNLFIPIQSQRLTPRLRYPILRLCRKHTHTSKRTKRAFRGAWWTHQWIAAWLGQRFQWFIEFKSLVLATVPLWICDIFVNEKCQLRFFIDYKLSQTF